MRKIIFPSLMVVAALLLGACGTIANDVRSQASQVLQQASENLAPDQSNETVQANPDLTKILAPVPTATPGAPVVVLPSKSADLMAAYEGALTSIYDTVNPSVVNIRVISAAQPSQLNLPDGQQMPEIPGLPFNFGPFGNPDQPNQPDQGNMPQRQGLGSGFVWDKEGHIVTNNHVIEDATTIEVTFADGTTVPAELVGKNSNSDLAVIKVDVNPEMLQPVQLANSNKVKVGQIAIAIGNPFGLEGSMTTGIISAIGRVVPANKSAAVSGTPSYSIPDIIQTDAPINPGNSGGVLVNDQGQVLGVTFMIESTSGASAGIGFVIPASAVSRVVPALIENGTFQHPYLGISGMTINSEFAKAMGLDSSQRGVLVGDVNADGPAGKAGLKGSTKNVQIDGRDAQVGGDVITAIDGEPVQGMDDLISYLSKSTAVGQKVTVSIIRNGDPTSVDVTLEARPTQQTQTAEAMPTAEPQQASNRVYMGITAGSLIPQIADAMGLSKDQSGVLVEQVEVGSPADKAGLRGSDKSATIDGQPVMIGGDVIVAIDGKTINSMEDLAAVLQTHKPGDQITLTVLRGGEQMELDLTLSVRPGVQQ